MTREVIHLNIVRSQNVDRSQIDPRPQTPLNNLTDLGCFKPRLLEPVAPCPSEPGHILSKSLQGEQKSPA